VALPPLPLRGPTSVLLPLSEAADSVSASRPPVAVEILSHIENNNFVMAGGGIKSSDKDWRPYLRERPYPRNPSAAGPPHSVYENVNVI
jgi:hypothetical protein